jgi:5-methyltetrahydropteroyltriglutamate--homocysteine methyltransferase
MAKPGRILTTHVGSLIRPPALAAYINAMESGIAVDRDAFEACLRKSVADVVKRQAGAGIDVVSDGEFGKFRGWSFYVADRLEGFREEPVEAGRTVAVSRDWMRFSDFYSEYFPTQKLGRVARMICTSPIRYKGREALKRDIDNFKAGLKGVKVDGAFMPVVAPGSAVPWGANEHYESEGDFLFALAEAMREEYAAIVKAGLTVQIDDAFLPYMYDAAFKDSELKKYRKWAELRIDALNHALKGIPEGKARYHICWGSFNTPHLFDIPLKVIVDLVLKVDAGAYCIEMANPRHEHEWRLWESVKLPDGKMLVPGVISHATNIVEHPELVAERLVRLANLIGRDNIMGGTDCGFAQGSHVQRVHPSIMWAKLEALAEGARIASRQLWKKKRKAA